MESGMDIHSLALVNVKAFHEIPAFLGVKENLDNERRLPLFLSSLTLFPKKVKKTSGIDQNQTFDTWGWSHLSLHSNQLVYLSFIVWANGYVIPIIYCQSKKKKLITSKREV